MSEGKKPPQPPATPQRQSTVDGGRIIGNTERGPRGTTVTTQQVRPPAPPPPPKKG